MNKLEKQCKVDGCEVNLDCLRQQGGFLAPPDMHAKIKDSIAALAQIEELKFTVGNSAFAVLIEKKPELLLNIVKTKCYLEKKISTRAIPLSIPKSKVGHSDGATATATAKKPTGPATTESITIGQSTINITIGDLTTQMVSTISEPVHSSLMPMFLSRIGRSYRCLFHIGDIAQVSSP